MNFFREQERHEEVRRDVAQVAAGVIFDSAISILDIRGQLKRDNMLFWQHKVFIHNDRKSPPVEVRFISGANLKKAESVRIDVGERKRLVITRTNHKDNKSGFIVWYWKGEGFIFKTYGKLDGRSELDIKYLEDLTDLVADIKRDIRVG